MTVSYPITSNTNLANITLNPVARIPETGEAIEFNVITGPDIEFPSEVTYDEIYLTGQKFVLRATDQFNREGTCSFTVRLTGELLYPFPPPPPKIVWIESNALTQYPGCLLSILCIVCFTYLSTCQVLIILRLSLHIGERCSYWKSSMDCIVCKNRGTTSRWGAYHREDTNHSCHLWLVEKCDMIS